MAVTKAKKQEILNELLEKLEKAKSVVLIQNKGINVEDLTKLKKSLREHNVEMKVAKKTLIQKVWEQLKFPALMESALEGPIALVLSYEDEMVAAKTLKAFMKDNEKLVFTGGMFEGKVFDNKSVLSIAGLPSKPELVSKLLGSLQSPLYGLHHALQYHLRGLAQVLSQIQKQKSGQSA